MQSMGIYMISNKAFIELFEQTLIKTEYRLCLSKWNQFSSS